MPKTDAEGGQTCRPEARGEDSSMQWKGNVVTEDDVRQSTASLNHAQPN